MRAESALNICAATKAEAEAAEEAALSAYTLAPGGS